jgi:type II restriction enzyme
MADRDRLRIQRTGTIINTTSKKQETEVIQSLERVIIYLDDKFGKRITLSHSKQWRLGEIVGELRQTYPEMEFHHHFDNTYIRPDGGLLFIESSQEDALTYPILISEVKNQGTNDLRASEGLPRQARGNAIERLGKNVIGLRTVLMRESIFPFVCFGYGCDFEDVSSILDRVSTMAMFGRLNKTYLHNEEGGRFNRGSFYFREEQWSVDEMTNVMKDIAERSILYYFSKYGEDYFLPS